MMKYPLSIKYDDAKCTKCHYEFSAHVQLYSEKQNNIKTKCPRCGEMNDLPLNEIRSQIKNMVICTLEKDTILSCPVCEDVMTSGISYLRKPIIPLPLGKMMNVGVFFKPTKGIGNNKDFNESKETIIMDSAKKVPSFHCKKCGIIIMQTREQAV